MIRFHAYLSAVKAAISQPDRQQARNAALLSAVRRQTPITAQSRRRGTQSCTVASYQQLLYPNWRQAGSTVACTAYVNTRTALAAGGVTHHNMPVKAFEAFA